MIIVRYLKGLNRVDLSKVDGLLKKGIKEANEYFTSDRIPKIKSIQFIEPNKVVMDVDCETENKYDNHLLRYALTCVYRDQGVKLYGCTDGLISKKDRHNKYVESYISLISKNNPTDKEVEAISSIKEILDNLKENNK